jgi:hypothetical protein
MGTVAIIVLGVAAISVVGALGDMISKIAKAKARAGAESVASVELERPLG